MTVISYGSARYLDQFNNLDSISQIGENIGQNVDTIDLGNMKAEIMLRD